MGFLRRLLNYKNIVIQCHDNPDADALASAFGIYRYLQINGIQASIVYGGEQIIKKSCTKMMVKECEIPVVHTNKIENCDLLLLVDCQCGATNVKPLNAPVTMIVDHHVQMAEDQENFLIQSECQSCSTIVYELLEEEGYCVKADEKLTIALLYGLYTDTAGFLDLFMQRDIDMRKALSGDYPLFEQLIKSNMSIAELLVASDAMYNHYFDPEYRFAIVSALKCDQTILGMIGDFVIQVDAVLLSFSYAEADAGYHISLRSCYDKYPADKIAAYVCKDIGGGGGHKKKAGGKIEKSQMIEKYGTDNVFEVVYSLLCQYMLEEV